MENKKKAERILAALDNSKAPISWYCIDEEELFGCFSVDVIGIVGEVGGRGRRHLTWSRM